MLLIGSVPAGFVNERVGFSAGPRQGTESRITSNGATGVGYPPACPRLSILAAAGDEKIAAAGIEPATRGL
jgi:hypothetical protein